MKMTTHLHLVLRLRIHGAILPLPMSSWCHAKLSIGAILPLHILFLPTGRGTYFANSDFIEFITYIHHWNYIYYIKIVGG
jgi:hypothetical protein